MQLRVVRCAKRMKSLFIILIAYSVEISMEFSFELDSKNLFRLDNGCKNVDIRFDYRYFERLSKCKTIHGFLRISDLHVPQNVSLTFAEIHEVTGYILIDNVSGLKSLSHLFPNISVIRGEMLHQGYSFVITNNDDLQYIGTGLMTYIMNGNVRIENNKNLCYIESVDWTHLRNGSITLINKNNNNFCNETCSKCWSNDIPQLLCRNCKTCSIFDTNECCDEECVGGCNQISDCLACKNFKFNDGNSIKCTNYQPLTFQLENYFLINGKICDEMGRMTFDEECIKKDDCPIEENHFYEDDHCVYCQNCTLTNCSISIKNIRDINRIHECHVANGFEITSLEDNKHRNIQKLLMKKLQNIVEIRGCLSITNSPAIVNMNFLKKLKKITVNDDEPSCYIDNVKYSVILENNENLQSGFDDNLKIKVSEGVRIENNANLCQNELKNIENSFMFTSNKPKFEVQTTECRYPKINVHTIVTENSALILLDTIKSSPYNIRLVYLNDGVNKIEEMTNSYHEIQNLASFETYSFKIVVLDEFGEILYDTTYNFFKTLLSNELLSVYDSSSDLDTISIDLVYMYPIFPMSEDYYDDDIDTETPDDFIYYITYRKIKKDYCKTSKTLQNENRNLINDTNGVAQKYDEYYLNDPSSQIENFHSLDHVIINGTQDYLNITNLINSTCYRFNIFPCKQSNILTCRKSVTVIRETLTPDSTKKEESDNFTYILGCIVFIAIVVSIVLYCGYTRAKKKEITEIYIELRNKRIAEIDQYELERENIVQTKVLGTGEFGVVYQGYLRTDEAKLYAIKTLAPFKEFYEDSFIKEAQIMRRFNSHHVVKLIGYCTTERPFLVIMEFMMHGDLKKFMHKNRPIENQQNLSPNAQLGTYTTVPISKTSLHPIRPVHQMAIEIADGMMYLEDMKFIHCDLACRNLMVNETYTIKIGDFGLARELYHTDYYKPGSRNKKIPLRWMSPEALGTDEILPRYTSKSDVFSYGIVLFELVTCCETPYAGCLDEEVVEIIKMGRTLDRPENCDDKIFELMQKCWRFNPNERISFKEIIEYLLENFDIPNFSNVSYYHSNR